MKKLIALHDLTDESDIEAVIDDIMAAIEAEDDDGGDPVAKHTPGEQSHDQNKHGNREGKFADRAKKIETDLRAKHDFNVAVETHDEYIGAHKARQDGWIRDHNEMEITRIFDTDKEAKAAARKGNSGEAFGSREWGSVFEVVEKHHPGGVDHDQDLHGDREGAGGTTPPDASSSQPDPQTSASSSPGSTGVTLGEDEAFVREITDRYLAQVGPQMQHVADNAGIDQMSIAGERRGIDTMGMYSHWEGNDWQGYTKERTEWQAQMLAEMQTKQARTNGMEPLQDNHAVVMLGLPGAGKTFLVKNELNEIIDTREFLTINADDVKQKIIHQDTPPEIEGVQGDELASMAHEESSYMRKRWEQTTMASGTNIILDVTGANRAKTIKVLEQLKAGNYDISIVHADVSVGEAQASALRRAASGGEEGSLGRIVPPSFIAGMASPTAQGQDVIDENFDSYLPHVNSAYWYRTYPLNVERDKSEHKPNQLMWSTS